MFDLPPWPDAVEEAAPAPAAATPPPAAKA
jgi:hypothetical protein